MVRKSILYGSAISAFVLGNVPTAAGSSRDASPTRR